jgi:hypothetical protein
LGDRSKRQGEAENDDCDNDNPEKRTKHEKPSFDNKRGTSLATMATTARETSQIQVLQPRLSLHELHSL